MVTPSMLELKNAPQKQFQFESLSPPQQNQIKQNLIQVLVSARHSRPVNNSVAQAVGCLGATLLPKNQWPELLPSLFKMTNTNNPLHKESFLKVLNNLAEYSFATLRNSLKELKGLLLKLLADADPNVKRAAFEATASVIAEVEEGQELDLFKDTLPIYFRQLVEAAKSGDDDFLKSLCQTLAEIGKLKCDFFRDALLDVAKCIKQIVSQGSLDWESRRLATELLVTLAQYGPGMVRQNMEFCGIGLPLVLEFLRLYDDDMNFNDPGDDNEQHNIFFGQGGVQHFAEALGAKKFLTIALPIVETWLSSGNWKDRYAASQILVFSLPVTAEVLGLEKILQCAALGVKDERVEVAFTAYDLLKIQLEQDYETENLAYMKAVFECVLNSIRNPKCHWRIKQQCCRVILLSCSGTDGESAAPFSAELLKWLGELISGFNFAKVRNEVTDENYMLHPEVILIEDACVAVASLAECMDKEFRPYYSVFAPLFKKFLTEVSSDVRFTSMQGKVLFTIGAMGLAVGSEMFEKDASEMMQMLLPNYVSGNHHDDVEPQIMAFFGQIAKTMGERFSPHLPSVVPYLLQVVQIQGGTVVPKGAELPDDPNLLTVEIHLRGQGDYHLLLNPVIMEKQNMAANMLFTYCETLPVGFWPFVPKTVECMKPLMSYAYDPNIRNCAIGILTPLIRSCRCAIEQGKASKTDLSDLFASLFEPFVKALAVEPKVEEKDLTLESINDTLEAYGLPLTQKQQVEMASLLKQIIDDMTLRRNDYLKDAQKQGMDEEAKKIYDELVDTEDKFLQSVVMCNKRIAQLSGGSYIQTFEKILGATFRELLTKSAGEICWALACFDDLIEVAKPESVQVYGKFLQEVMIKFKDNKDEWITQNVAYGVHVLTEANALDNLSSWVEWLMFQIENPAGRNTQSIENCTSALGILIRDRPQQCPPEKVLPFFISKLPIIEDEEEVETSCRVMCDLAPKHPNMIQSNREKVQFILLSGLGSGALSEKTGADCVKLLGMLTSEASQLENLLKMLDPVVAQNAVALLQTGI